MTRTTEECRRSLERLAENLARADDDVRGAAALHRTVSCHLTDLDTTFTGRLADGRVEDLDQAPGPPAERAQVRLAMASDDLIALVDGELHFARAWATGRVKLEAGFRDLLRLRSLL
ncbi:SCP2 sterol-binding domain-containing protein [Streptomyces zingiberis]|uniref:SCP2 sterol-binding domain-containing protein n=1 Tax=Streptomyces zingiberis TaxID=2053010 RepID=A0ABX1BYD1_9ACTN|nr:SCP2 sterol-binding domain-containing protein [Streptomyces zingiberis]NJQ01308.1 SCP2 sterol-binding domain-containing protein [Streptomyces zingiberis]